MESTRQNCETSAKRVDFNTTLVCVDYPGIVKNVDKMIETLGGINEIEKNISNRKKTLNLKFRPDDLYSKATVSDLNKKPGILVKLTHKGSSIDGEPEFDYDVVGVTALTFSFNRLCDFQYLPLVASEEETSSSPLTHIYNKIIPKELPEKGWLFDIELDDMPYFLPPALFSRCDNTPNHLYFNRSKFYEGRFKPEYIEMLRQQELDRKNSISLSQKLISKKSGHGGIFCSIRDSSFPTAPPKLAMQFLNLKYTNKGAYEKLKALFEERPIWSRTAVLYTSGIALEQLKFVLPAVAFHFRNGPWRIMWCRYGYDPRNDPSSRIYQTFDFRVRATAGLKAKVTTKRQHKSLGYRATSPIHISKISLNEVVQSTSERNFLDESTFMLKPGMIPPARQMFYQYCDVHLPEIESMLNKLPPIIPGTICDNRNGWLPNKFTDQCREIVNRYIIKQVQTSTQEHSKRQGEDQTELDTSSSITKNSDDIRDQEFLEISDSEIDSNSDSLPSESTDNDDDDDDYKALPKKGSSEYKKKAVPGGQEDEDEIDMEVEDVNKLLEENYAALKDFDRLVYDSD